MKRQGRNALHRAAGKLTSAIQKEWLEATAPEEHAIAERVMNRSLDLGRRCATTDVSEALVGFKAVLNGRFVAEYLGSAWVEMHPSVLPAILALEDAYITAMTKEEFLSLMQFPDEWDSSGMYPDELFRGQLSGYQVGDECASEHDRNGAFHWWLKRNPTRAQLEQILRLAILDPDPLMGADVRKHIRAAVAFDPGLSELEAQLLRAAQTSE